MKKRIVKKTNYNSTIIMQGRFIKRTVIYSSAISIFIGILGLLGYIPGMRFLGNVRPGYIPMAPSTAISFLLLSMILIIYTLGLWQRRTRFFGLFIAAVISIFGFLKLIEYYFNVERSFEKSIFRISGETGDIPIGLMSPSTGGLFFLSGIIMGLLLVNVPMKKYTDFIGHSAGILGSILFVGSLTFLMSYLYGQPLLYNMGRTVPMALTTAIAFLFSAIALIGAIGTKYTPLLFFTGPLIKNKLLRIFVPLIIFIIFIQDISTKVVKNIFEINDAIMMALWIICFAVIAGLIIFRLGYSIGKSLDNAQKEITSIARFPSENPNPIIRIDKEGMVIYSNDAGRIQLKILESKVGSKAPKIFCNLTERLFKGKDRKSESLNIQLGDKTYEFIITAIKDTNYANFYGRDITDRIRAEDKLKNYSKNLEKMVEERTKDLKAAQEKLIRKEKLAVLGQLAGGVGHELRNPLAAIKNASYFLNMKIKKPEPVIKTTLDILDKEIARSEVIISSILDFASPKAPIKKKVNIGSIIKEVVTQTTIPDNIEVLTILDKSMSAILADPGQITQIFSNIILNAVQAMPEGGKLTVGSKIIDKKWQDISVSDTGVGIPEENIDKIFEPLYTSKPKGIGLGLAIIKILIDGHRGKINIQSKIGEGTTFTVSLPLIAER